MAHLISSLCFLCLLGTIALIFGMKYRAAAHQAKLRVDQDESLRTLAAKAVEAQAQGAAARSLRANEFKVTKPLRYQSAP